MSDVASRGNRAEETRRERRFKPGSTSGANMRLAVDESRLDRSRYEYRWVNGHEARMHEVHRRDWDPAPEVSDTSTETRFAGTDKGGRPYGAVLMRKPRDWHEADTKAKLKRVHDTTAAIEGGTFHRQDERELRDGVYTPGGRNRIEG